MTTEEVTNDINRAITKLTNTLELAEYVAKSSDQGALRKACGGVSDFHAWAEQQRPAPEVPVTPDEGPPAPDEETPADEKSRKSEVADLSAEDAKDHISRMRSTDRLEAIVVSENRVTVQQAAQKRLDELEESGHK